MSSRAAMAIWPTFRIGPASRRTLDDVDSQVSDSAWPKPAGSGPGPGAPPVAGDDQKPVQYIVVTASDLPAQLPPDEELPKLEADGPNRWKVLDDPQIKAVELLPDGTYRVRAARCAGAVHRARRRSRGPREAHSGGAGSGAGAGA